MTELSEFRPDWASAPGDTIADVLEEMGISVAAFSERIGRSLEETYDLLAGRVAITLALARKLQSELGSSAEFWMSRDFHYRSTVTRLSDADTREWLSELPVGDMVRLKWIEPVSPSQELSASLRFFDVPNITAWTPEGTDGTYPVNDVSGRTNTLIQETSTIVRAKRMSRFMKPSSGFKIPRRLAATRILTRICSPILLQFKCRPAPCPARK